MKWTFVTVGVGPFNLAAKRLGKQLKGVFGSEARIHVIDHSILNEIASAQGVNCRIFEREVPGFGYWMWKPMVISFFLQRTDGFICYLDAGCEIDPVGLKNLLLEFSLRPETFLLSPTGQSVASMTESWVVDEVFPEATRECREAPMVQGGIVFLRSNDISKLVYDCLTEWVKSERVSLFRGTVEDILVRKNELNHRCDQSLLNLVLHKQGLAKTVLLFPNGLTPPKHKVGFLAAPPLIASRNSSSFVEFEFLMRYKHRECYPKWLIWARGVINKAAAKEFNNHLILALAISVTKISGAVFRMNRLRKNLTFSESIGHWKRLSDS